MTVIKKQRKYPKSLFKQCLRVVLDKAIEKVIANNWMPPHVLIKQPWFPALVEKEIGNFEELTGIEGIQTERIKKFKITPEVLKKHNDYIRWSHEKHENELMMKKLAEPQPIVEHIKEGKKFYEMD